MRTTVALVFVALAGCDGKPAPSSPKPPSPSPSSPPATSVDRAPVASAAPSATKKPEPVRVESVTLEDERIVFVLRGARGSGSGVFLHGVCGHGLGYLQSFQHAAAEHGRWVAPHGDAPCGAGPFRSWTGRIRRIHDHSLLGLREAGVSGAPKDVTLIGYSLGATRALALAREFPDVYTLLVLIAAPSMPAPAGLGRVRGAVMMAGTRDRQDKMQAGARAFQRAGIPSTYQPLPGAAHGEMGSSPEAAMAGALDWLDENARP